MKPGEQTPSPDDVCDKCGKSYNRHSPIRKYCPRTIEPFDETAVFTPSTEGAGERTGERDGITPGEWVINSDSRVVDGWGLCVAIPYGRTAGEARANAELIRSAPQLAERCERLEREKKELDKKIENLKSVMVAAAEEIQEHWDAHCDKEGYGPTNLMHRLKQGLASEYCGYKPGAFLEQANEMKDLINVLREFMEDTVPFGNQKLSNGSNNIIES